MTAVADQKDNDKEYLRQHISGLDLHSKMLSEQTSPHPTMDSKPQTNHRRQQSTPVQYEVSNNIPYNFPAHHHVQYQGAMHRRGMSSGYTYHHIPGQQCGRFRQPQEQLHQVGIGRTNTGQPTEQQHYTQVAQQQAQARPGLQEPDIRTLQELRRIEHQRIDQEIDTLISQGRMHSFQQSGDGQEQRMERSRSDQGSYGGMRLAVVPGHGAMGNGLLAPFEMPTAAEVRRPSTSRSDSTGFDGRPQHAPWQAHMQRSRTPENRGSTEDNSTTPSTPFVVARPEEMPQRSCSPRMTEEMDTNETIKPSRSQQARPGLSSIFESECSSEHRENDGTVKGGSRPSFGRGFSYSDMFQPRESHDGSEFLMSPPNTAPTRHSRHFDLAILPGEVRPLGFGPVPDQHGANPASVLHTPLMASPLDSTFHAPSTSHHMSKGGDVAVLVPVEGDYSRISPPPSVRDTVDWDNHDSPQRQSRDMSFADLSLDATIEDTGISAEEVQQYISQPDPVTGKWTCLYEEDGVKCGKVHGRKENARAHVQTHLNDRQFKCIHCGKKFVRQHDLKRHSKTHSGIKPYPCQCGNSFARHDALTRHRQRGICTGGFEGVVKKAAKRGRPKKQRPDDDERTDKAARTRKRVAAKEYASSVSGTSSGSGGNSPMSSNRDLSHAGYTQAGAMPWLDGASEGYGFLLQTPPLSPSILSMNLQTSPTKALSATSERASAYGTGQNSPQLSRGASPVETNQAHSQYSSAMSSPPELSHSSPPASAKLPDFDFSGHFDEATSNDQPEEQQDHSSPVFDDIWNTQDTRDSTPWKDEEFFNFGDSTGAFSSKFPGFDDDVMLTSDGAEINDNFF